MKLIKMIFVFFVYPFFLSACALLSSGETIEIQCNDFYENPHITDSIEVGVGDEFTINLCSNASTGFQWIDMANINDPNILEQTSHEYIGPSQKVDPPAPGTPGSQVWSFKALESGTSFLSFEYSRDWDGGEKGEWTFVLTVDVE